MAASVAHIEKENMIMNEYNRKIGGYQIEKGEISRSMDKA
jgi:hypothetical protein